jgi:hypothetical protein
MAHGIDPRNARVASRKVEKPIPIFSDIARIVIDDAQSRSTNALVRYQWERHLGPAYSGPPLFPSAAGATAQHDTTARADALFASIVLRTFDVS